MNTGSIFLNVYCEDKLPSDDDVTYSIILHHNDVVFARLLQALEEGKRRLEKEENNHRILNIFGDKNDEEVIVSPIIPFRDLVRVTSPELGIESTIEKMTIKEPSLPDKCFYFFQQQLNFEQKSAVISCMTTEKAISIIHGPPGTGKTSTLAELIIQTMCLKPDISILVSGPSNASVDNLLKRVYSVISKPRVIRQDGAQAISVRSSDLVAKLLRIGHPGRIADSVTNCSLEQRLYEENKILGDIKSEIEAFLQVRDKRKQRLQRSAYQQLKDLRRELKDRERRAIDDLLIRSVVFSTLSGLGGSLIKKRPQKCEFYDLVIIDEAGQATQPECLIGALLCGRRLVLSGDHFQLPPTVLAPTKDLEVSLLEKIYDHKTIDRTMLYEQYRMHPVIMGWANQEFYNRKLRVGESVIQRNLLGVEDFAMVFVDTCGHACYDVSSIDSRVGMHDVGSRMNIVEARIVINHCRKLIEGGISPKEIAIITPYNAQVSLIKDGSDEHSLSLPVDVEVGTVDGFQGKEFDVVLISLVRSNLDGEIGFLAETRRTNVAITRAKRHVFIVGDSNTLGRHQFYSRLFDYISTYGDIRFISNEEMD